MKKIFAALVVLASVSAWAAPQTVTLSVPGMDCASCPITIKAALTKVPGVTAVSSDLARRQTKVSFDDSKTNAAALTRATTDAGYPSTLAKAPQ